MAPTGPARWERAYIFISSTFNDMHAERDYLVKRVFPELAAWCESRRLRMVDVDLRWGVTEQDATRNSAVVQVCLRRIDECRPFFVCLLGQRYGWVPRARDVSARTFDDFPGLAAAVDEGRSVTELEILHAIVHPFLKDAAPSISEHAIFYQRHPVSLREMPREPPQRWRMFTDIAEPDPDARRFLLARRRHLRKTTLPACGRPVRVYRGAWNEAARSPELELPLQSPAVLPENIERWRQQWRDAGIAVTGFEVDASSEEGAKARAFNARLGAGRLEGFTSGGEPLAARMLADLQAAIDARFPGRAPAGERDALGEELAQQEQFQFVASEGFVDRDGDFATLDAYAAGAGDRPLVITAPAGAGKSMLLARWLELMQAADVVRGRATVHYRFIGASDRSTSVASLLTFILEELRAAGRIDGAVPDDPSRLRQLWPELLAQAGRAAPLILVIDALDQLQSGLSDLTWIPHRLPPGVKIIVSFRRDASRADGAVERFRAMGAVMSEIRPFTDVDDRRRLVRAYLEQYLKELDEPHLEALITSAGAANPLFLKIALTELRVFGAFANLASKIATDFGDSPETAFGAVLRRLETDPVHSPVAPEIAVPIIFGALAEARRGLSVEEMAAVLCRATGRNRTSPAEWQAATDAVHLVVRQVRAFLARRDGRFDFFYETFRQAASARYVAGHRAAAGARPRAEWHALLADYFFGLPLWSGASVSAAARTPNARKVSELPFHLTMAGDGKRAAKILTDLDFIEAAASAGRAHDLAEDYGRLPPAMRTAAVDEFAEFVRSQAHVLARWPDLAFQQAANTISYSADPGVSTPQSAPAKAAAYRLLTGLESRPWIRRLNPSPTASACRMTLLGHDGPVLRTVVTPDGGRLISVGADRSLRVWDLATGSPIEVARNITGGGGALACVAGTALAATANAQSQIVLWNYENLQVERDLPGPRSGVTWIAADASGRWLAAGSASEAGTQADGALNTLTVYDVKAGALRDTGTYARAVQIGAFVSAAPAIVCARGSVVEVFDASASVRARLLDATRQHVSAIAVSSDETALAIADGSGAIQVWDAKSWALVRTLYAPQGLAQDMAFSPDGRELATAGIDGTIVIWNVATGDSLTTLYGHTAVVNSIAYTPDGASLVSAGVDGSIRVWDPAFGRPFCALARTRMSERLNLPALRSARDARDLEMILHVMGAGGRHRQLVTRALISPDNRRAMTCGIDDTTRVWNFETGQCAQVLEGHHDGIFDLALSRDGRSIVSADRAMTVKLWDAETGRERASRTLADAAAAPGAAANILAALAHERRRPVIAPVVFADSDRLVLTADTRSHAIHAWNALTLEPEFTLDGHRGRVRAILPVVRGCRALSVGLDGAVILWSLESHTPIAARTGYAEAVRGVGHAAPVVMTDDQRVACAWSDGTIRLLDSDTLVETGILRGESGTIASMSASSDVVASARPFGDGTVVEAWRAGTGARVFRQVFHSEHVAVDVEREGERLAIGGPHEPITVWELEHGRAIRRFPAEPTCLAFARGRLIAANGIGEVFLLELTPR